VLGDVAQYGHLITRAAPDANFPNLPGRIISIDQRYINIGGTKIQGIDTNLQYSAPPTPYGRFRITMSGTYYIKYDVQQNDGSYAGFISNTFASAVTGVTPRWKSYQTVSWDNGPWSIVLGNSYQSSYTDAQCDFTDTHADADCELAAGGGLKRTVSSMSLWDLQTSWKGWKNVTLTLGAKNLLDTNPPKSNQQNSFQLGFDPSYYDPRGRVVYVQATYKFK